MGKGGGGAPPQGNADNSMDFLWTIAFIIAAGGLTWYFGKGYIIPVLFKIKFYEILAIQNTLRVWSVFARALHLPFFLIPAESNNLSNWLAYMHQAIPGGVEYLTVRDLSIAVGNYLRYPIVFVLTVLAALLSLTHVTLRFKNVFDMRRIRDAELGNWPQITPVAKLNLVKIDLDEKPWGMSAQPMQFVRKNGMVVETTKEGKPVVELTPGAAHRVFSLQMGPFWAGLEPLPPYMRALFAAFAAKANRDGAGAGKFLAQISKSADSGKLNFSGTRLLLMKHVRNKMIGRVVGRHAYVYTVMASMLELARTDGVLATSDFLWLKPLDRRLWYILNNVGRQTAFVEVAGPFGHWLIEKKLRRPLKVPMVAEAVIGLETALSEILFNPDTM